MGTGVFGIIRVLHFGSLFSLLLHGLPLQSLTGFSDIIKNDYILTLSGSLTINIIWTTGVIGKCGNNLV